MAYVRELLGLALLIGAVVCLASAVAAAVGRPWGLGVAAVGLAAIGGALVFEPTAPPAEGSPDEQQATERRRDELQA